MFENKFNIQLFADSVGKVNTVAVAASGADDNRLAPEMKVHYDKTLIDKAGPHLVHEQFADKRNLPLNAGQTVDFRCVEALPKAITPIVEGVNPEPGKITISNKRATVDQYGAFVPVSDKLEMTAPDPLIVEMAEKSGEQMGVTRDTVIRDIINAGTNVMFPPTVDENGVESVPDKRKLLTANSKLTVRAIQRAVAKLRMMNAPTFDGYYMLIIHPGVETDIMNDPAWVEANKYATPENIKAGEIGRIAGVRVVESTEAKIWKDETCPEGLSVYSCLFIGKGAYAVTDLEGAGSEMIIKPKESGGTANPLNLYGTIGWKALMTGVILSEEYMVRLECCSGDFPTTEAN